MKRRGHWSETLSDGLIPLRRLEDARRQSTETKALAVEGSTIEIERKFLINAADIPSDYREFPRREIIQGYVSTVDDGREVRLRTKGGQYYLTIKGGGLKTRFESEIEISRRQFSTLWPATVGYRVEKHRHEIPYGEHLIELDIFHGDLEGLITAEVEFDTKKRCNKFKPPKWFGREVTQDIRYKNKTMSRYGLPSGFEDAKTKKSNKRLHATAVPIRVNDGDIEFCLITTLKRGHWSFPNGVIGTSETFVEAAVKEAQQEAGLRGHLWGDPLGKYRRRKRGKKVEATVVLLVVTACDSGWPDSDQRRRKWVSAKQACRLLRSADLKRFVQIAEARVSGHPSQDI